MTGSEVDPSEPGDTALSDTTASPKRVIKRYSNRKLYDTKHSTYVTLLNIAEMVRAGEEVQIIDNATKEDKTDVTLALIISEELKARPRGIPLATLKALIRNRSVRIISQLRDGPIGKLIPKDGDDTEEVSMSEVKEGAPRGLRATLEQWQATIDERIRTVLPDFKLIRELQQEVARLNERLERLESKLDHKQNSERGE
jgi:polyhydroxyalkanoate synthesis repressor PhaR